MTSPAEPPSPNAPTPADQVTRPLRELAALVLLGANAVFLFVGLIRLLAPQGAYSTVTGRAGSAFFAFIGLEAVVLPVLAVLLATHIAPAVPKAKLITQVALIEYAISAVLGGLTLLVWLVGRLAEAQIFDALTGLLTRVAWVALFGVAAYVVWSVWRRLYHVPRPKAEPGLYGTPHPGWPGQPGDGSAQSWYQGQSGYPNQSGYQGQSGYPGQSGYEGQSGYPGQPGYQGQTGYPGQSDQAGYPGQPGPGHPGGGWSTGDQSGRPGAGQETGAGQGRRPDQGTYASQAGQGTGGSQETGYSQGRQPASSPESASPHTWPPHGQPAVPPQAPPSAAPTSAAPASAPPASAPLAPASAPPFGQPASADPTQTMPRQSAEPTEEVTRQSPEQTEEVRGQGAESTQALPRSDGDGDRTQRIDPGGRSA
ncbi:hypothetical protein ACGFIK_03815 [Micromonospora sp. NPDC048871]|uniref:hypothetical protein n=1 Tax=Micromonospora sp. NPDC048871 TaxID=3364259 RepID=UPI003719AB69